MDFSTPFISFPNQKYPDLMCACNLKMVPKAKAAAYAYQIPITEFSAPNSRCQFKVWYCTSPEKVNKVLATVPIKPGDPDLKVTSMEAMERLADHYDSGKFVAYYNVDLKKLLRDNLHFTQEELTKTECNLACTY